MNKMVDYSRLGCNVELTVTFLCERTAHVETPHRFDFDSRSWSVVCTTDPISSDFLGHSTTF